ncbi:hypothetical protein [Actinophytocola algeriensis]|uniref:Uncharacterized protein n=1 Tax=Actinophytocola algeriensis TaxID=1768010 RepID=A0A7W7Q9G2_9PSEU|nr:hypothetical protein [Actinophytocola algeriensis]MBB4909500.1 hypothetical protein [Actinophytocola algeriensis]MBE1475490.1 hypothetical protein [Actinophytocola algeriensis]
MGIRAGALALLTAFMISGCAARAPDPEPNLFAEYTRSTNVEHDRYATGGSSGDRRAFFASRYRAEELASRLFLTFECGESLEGDPFDTSCDLDDAVREAVREAGGDEDAPTARVIIVKHADESLALLTLYVADGTLIDSTGETHDGLDDFVDDNDLLSHDDVIMAPRDITAVPGEGRLVTIYGHAPPTWQWWALGGIAVVMLLSGAGFLRRQLRS